MTYGGLIADLYTLSAPELSAEDRAVLASRIRAALELADSAVFPDPDFGERAVAVVDEIAAGGTPEYAAERAVVPGLFAVARADRWGLWASRRRFPDMPAVAPVPEPARGPYERPAAYGMAGSFWHALGMYVTAGAADYLPALHATVHHWEGAVLSPLSAAEAARGQRVLAAHARGLALPAPRPAGRPWPLLTDAHVFDTWRRAQLDAAGGWATQYVAAVRSDLEAALVMPITGQRMAQPLPGADPRDLEFPDLPGRVMLTLPADRARPPRMGRAQTLAAVEYLARWADAVNHLAAGQVDAAQARAWAESDSHGGWEIAGAILGNTRVRGHHGGLSVTEALRLERVVAVLLAVDAPVAERAAFIRPGDMAAVVEQEAVYSGCRAARNTAYLESLSRTAEPERSEPAAPEPAAVLDAATAARPAPDTTAGTITGPPDSDTTPTPGPESGVDFAATYTADAETAF